MSYRECAMAVIEAAGQDRVKDAEVFNNEELLEEALIELLNAANSYIDGNGDELLRRLVAEANRVTGR